MAPGRPAKKACQNHNISGLKNLSRHASVLSESSSNPTLPRSQAPSSDGDESDLEEDDADLDLLIHFDSLKTNFEQEEASQGAEEEEDGEVEEWEGFGREDLADAMIGMFEADDLDWLPQKFQTRRDKRKKGKYSPLFRIFDCLSCNQRGPRHI
jgi:hypothetical protein